MSEPSPIDPAAAFADTPTIEGDRIVLRPIVASDAGHMWRDLGDAEAMRLTGTHATFTRDQIDRYCASRADQDDRWDLAIVERSTGAWAGEVVLLDWNPDDLTCGFRIALSAHARDRGIGTEATRLVVDHAFATTPVNRIGLDVFEFNPRAVAVYERVGFVREGVEREALRWDGEFVDAIRMSVLRREWAARQVRPATTDS